MFYVSGRLSGGPAPTDLSDRVGPLKQTKHSRIGGGEALGGSILQPRRRVRNGIEGRVRNVQLCLFSLIFALVCNMVTVVS